VPANQATFLSGFKNRIINPNFLFWDYGTGVTVPDGTSTYVCNRWIIQQHLLSGFAYTQGVYAANDSSAARVESVNYLQMGNTGNTDSVNHYNILAQRIEAVQYYAGKTLSYQLVVFNGGSARNIAIEFYEHFGTGGSSDVTGIGPKVLTVQPGLNILSGQVAIPNIASGTTIGAGNYLQIIIWLSGGTTFNTRNGSLGAQSGTLDFEFVQVEEGSSFSAFDIRPQGIERFHVQRYYNILTNLRNIGTVSGATAIGSGVTFPAMRATPTATFTIITSTNVTAGTSAFLPQSNDTGNSFITATAAGNVDCTYTVTLNAEL
jgi:hypothetical protein